MLEEKAGENFSLKQSLDGMRSERDKGRQAFERVEDQLRQKEMEITQVNQKSSMQSQ